MQCRGKRYARASLLKTRSNPGQRLTNCLFLLALRDAAMLRRSGHRLAVLAKCIRTEAIRSKSSSRLRLCRPWSSYHEGAARGSLPLWAAALLAATAATTGLTVREQQRSPAQSHYRRFQDFYKLLEKTSPLGLGVSLA
jgi:hypothetical protein